MRTIADALAIWLRVYSAFEMAGNGYRPGGTPSCLTLAFVFIGTLRIGGFVGWCWIWLLIHIAFLIGCRNRGGVLLT